MKLSLRKRLILLVTTVILAVSLTGTFLFLEAQRQGFQKEITIRGVTMANALARAVSHGVAAENLDLIKQLEHMVHTEDVDLAQIYSSLWMALDSYPATRQNEPPQQEAIQYFKSSKSGTVPYFEKNGNFFDFYAPIYYQYDEESEFERGLLIGYVRLRLSTEAYQQTMLRSIATNISMILVLTLTAIILLLAIIRKYLLNPILHLHKSASLFKKGTYPEKVQVFSEDEIGQLSMEFNEMTATIKERESSLAEEKERLAVTLRSIGDAVIVADIEGKIKLINRVAEKITGWESGEAMGRPMQDVFRIIHEKSRERCDDPIERVLKSGVVIGLAKHTALIRKDGTEILIEDSAAPIRDRESRIFGVVLVFRDITEKRKMEDEILKVEKLESLGILAGGLAHDFNNLLTAIIGNISLAKIHLQPGDKAIHSLQGAEIASQRAVDLTRRLLTFSRGGAPIRKVTSVIDILQESAGFVLSGTNVSSEFQIGDRIWNVDIDAGQISQVFNNLIINAVQAMPEGGTIVFSLSNVILGKDHYLPLGEGRYVRIDIRDSGTGIPQEYLPKIFDPYFTTKQKGSGLGLASVYSIITRHDGHVTAVLNPTKGMTFTVYLPASLARDREWRSKEAGISKGCGHILLMDDDKMIREMASEMLLSLGYQVTLAQNGTEAIELYRKSISDTAPFDAVILDLTIPGGMGGKETVRQLLEIDPNVKAIVSSGYSNDLTMAEYQKYGFCAVMTKPYNIGTLSKALEEIAR